MKIILYDEQKIWLKRKKQEMIAWQHELDEVDKFYKFEWQCVFGAINCQEWDAACRIEYFDEVSKAWFSTAGKWANSLGVPDNTHPVSGTTFTSQTKTWFLPDGLEGKKVKIRLIASLEFVPYPNTMGFCNVQFDDLVVFGE